MTIEITFKHKPSFNNWLKDSGYTQEEEIAVYKKNLQDVYDNPRWYLDNLDFLIPYRVSWGIYKHGTDKEKLKAPPTAISPQHL